MNDNITNKNMSSLSILKLIVNLVSLPTESTLQD